MCFSALSCGCSLALRTFLFIVESSTYCIPCLCSCRWNIDSHEASMYLCIIHTVLYSSIEVSCGHYRLEKGRSLQIRPNSRVDKVGGRSAVFWWTKKELPIVSEKHCQLQIMIWLNMITGWWFGTFLIFLYIGDNHPNWLIFFRGVQTTNQLWFD